MANQKKEEVYRSKISRTRGDKVFDAVCAVMMVALCLIVAYPIWFVIIASFSDPYYITTGEVLFAPKGVSLNAYKLLLQRSDVWIGYFLYGRRDLLEYDRYSSRGICAFQKRACGSPMDYAVFYFYHVL